MVRHANPVIGLGIIWLDFERQLKMRGRFLEVPGRVICPTCCEFGPLAGGFATEPKEQYQHQPIRVHGNRHSVFMERGAIARLRGERWPFSQNGFTVRTCSQSRWKARHGESRDRCLMPESG